MTTKGKGEKSKFYDNQIVMKEEKLPKKYDHKYQNPILKELKNLVFYVQYFLGIILKGVLTFLAIALKILMFINGIFVVYFGWKVFVIGGERYSRNFDIFIKVLITEIAFFLLLKIIKIGKKVFCEKKGGNFSPNLHN